jgi:deoxyribose-phosphate aldolase
MVTAKDIALMIDHSLLRPELTVKDVEEGCKIAEKYGAVSVCVKPADVALSAKILKGTKVLVTTVIGFPHGSSTTQTKVFETEQAINDGAVEVDMVLNYGRLLSGEYDYVEKDVKAVVETAHKSNVLVKVIFENCFLTDELKVEACKICERAGADFVKTSTGFGTGGATIPDLKLMRANCPPHMRVKAAGGVRTLDSALEVRSVGVARFGATATIAIMDEAIKREKEGTLTEVK